MTKWCIGVDEAETLKTQPLQVRLNYFSDFFKYKLDKKPITDRSLKQELIEQFEKKGKKRRSSSSDETKNNMENNKSTTLTPEIGKKRKRSRLSEDNNRKKKIKITYKDGLIKIESTNNKKNKRSQVSETEDRLRPKRHPTVETSYSDTDSKFSENSSVPASLESQVALFKRNNLFKGVPKDKVCQVCEKQGEVLKCRGRCNGVYHYQCAIDLRANQTPIVEQRKTNKPEANTVEIVSIKSKKNQVGQLDGATPSYAGMDLSRMIDLRMKEIMKNFEQTTVYVDSTDSSSEADELTSIVEQNTDGSDGLKDPTIRPIIKHVTADDVKYVCAAEKDDVIITEKITTKDFKCNWCFLDESPLCHVCHKEQSELGSKFRQKCSLHQCGKFYHPECLKKWPQTQWSLIHSTRDKKSDASYDTFVCPRHACHTCISDDPSTANCRCNSDKAVKCLRCPATYHSSAHCIPAGSHILSSSQIVCPRHRTGKTKKNQQTINANWCFICSEGGHLICCETCPTSVHKECLPGNVRYHYRQSNGTGNGIVIKSGLFYNATRLSFVRF